MKLHVATPAGINIFTAYGEDYVAVNHEKHTQNIIVQPTALLAGWTDSTLDTLTAGDVHKLLGCNAEIILLGTGKQLRFPPADLLRPFARAGIGLEVMDLQAACRTYNILAAEGRNVAAALLFR